MSSTRFKRSAVLVAALTLVSAAAASCKSSPSQDAAPTTTAPSTTTSTTSTTTTTAAPVPVGPGTKVVVTRTGVVAPLVGVNLDGSVMIKTPCEQTASARGVTAVGPVDILVDPGHGGVENGAEGHGIPEKTINLAVAKHVVEALRVAGVPALLTRTGDYRVTLTQRANIAHALNPKAFVSVHHNGDSDGPREGPGTEMFFQHKSAESRRLAGILYEEVVAALSQYKDVAWQADRDAGAKPRLSSSGGDYYAMLRQPAPVVSVLAELLFMSNKPEADLVARPDVQKVEGDAVAKGIVRWLTTSDPGSGYVEPYERTQPAGGGGGSTNCVDPPLE